MRYYTEEMYKCSYKEVFTILMGFSIDDLQKIPREELQFFYNNMDKSYKYNIDYDKSLDELEMSPITEAILANLYRDYFADFDEKQKIIKKEEKELELLEIEKRKKYNPDEIFKKREVEEENIMENVDNLPVLIKEENIFSRILNFFKNKFSK